MKGPVLAIFCHGSAATPEALEFLRVLAGIVACGGELTLVTVGNDPTFEREDVPDDAQRYLDALAASGVSPSSASRAELRALLESAGAVVRLSRSGRGGKPDMLVLTDASLWDGSRTDDAIWHDVIHAGQVIQSHDSSP